MNDQPTFDPDLEEVRRRIDQIDEQVVSLLNDRAKAAIEVGRIKSQTGNSPTYAPEREQQVLERVRRVNPGPLPDACLEAVYRELMSGSFALQRPLRIGYLGPAGSFSHLAATRQFGSSVEYADVDDIPGVFSAIERDLIDLGLVPIENSTGGGITETLDSFLQFSAIVCAEVLIPVHHNVLSRVGAEQITRIYSRPEVFDQCRKWLSDHLQHAERMPVSSSAKAAQITRDEPNAAAVGSTLAGEIYGLPAVFTNIEDNRNNITRFFVIGRRRPKCSGYDKTAIMFTTAHKPGALADVLDVFRQHKVNLTHIDKRPSQRVNWEYYFFIDCEGHTEDENVTAAIDAAREHCLHLTILGSFPRAKTVLE